jgi:lipopolysaccharide export LptBFGC system permease protein LptF
MSSSVVKAREGAHAGLLLFFAIVIIVGGFVAFFFNYSAGINARVGPVPAVVLYVVPWVVGGIFLVLAFVIWPRQWESKMEAESWNHDKAKEKVYKKLRKADI